ncbi:MAG: DUF2332 domain-containing protein [Sphingomonadales bacterium]
MNTPLVAPAPLNRTAGAVIDALDFQAKYCDLMGSPLNALLLGAMSADYAARGITHALLSDWETRSPRDAVLSLRMVGGLHFLVLAGRAPSLAAYYPSAGGVFREDGLWSTAEAVLHAEAPFFEAFLRHPPQTNEVRRAGVLIGGFLTVAQETGLPLRCLEIGASAGLNLNWDRFRYAFGGGARWGDPASPVLIQTDWRGDGPDATVAATVAGRAGCDISPIDLSRPEAALRLKAFVWPDQLERFRTLEAALAVAARHPPPLETADAGDWLEAQLAEPRPGAATIVYHSIAAQYFSPETREAVHGVLTRAGNRATPEAPVAWLRMEAADIAALPEVILTLWPGREERLLGHAHPHGAFVQWKEPT